MLNDEIRTLIEDQRIPVWGSSSAMKMANEPPGCQPEDLLPGARSLLCFGTPLPRAVYRVPVYGLETVWRAQNLNYRRLDTLSTQFASILEENGERALPIFGCYPLEINKSGDVAGYLNLIRMGAVVGIGVVGRNGLLINSRYGARLMLGGVITTATLPEIRYPMVDEPGCPPDCRICEEACPVKAISADDKRVDIMHCLAFTARTPLMSRIKFFLYRIFRHQSAARLLNLTSFDEHTFHVCSQCVALCPYGD
jgi:epoxyqueuosine reductase QueG